MKYALVSSIIAASVTACSSVSYTEKPDGTRKLSRTDIGRNVDNESLELQNGATVSYSVGHQNESESFSRLIMAIERAILAVSTERTLRRRDDNSTHRDIQDIKHSERSNQLDTKVQGNVERIREQEMTRRILRR